VISQKEVNVKDNAKVFLTLTVPGDEVQKEYDALLKDYCDKAVIKGFRKGKVPAEVLLRKFGDEIRDETAFTIIRKSLEEAFDQIEEKPLAYAQPELTEKKEIETGKDFTFTVSYDTYPKVELGPYTGVKAEKTVVEISDEDMKRELAALQEKNSIVKEKKEGPVERGNIVTVDYSEIDPDGNPYPPVFTRDLSLRPGKTPACISLTRISWGWRRERRRPSPKPMPRSTTSPSWPERRSPSR